MSSEFDFDAAVSSVAGTVSGWLSADCVGESTSAKDVDSIAEFVRSCSALLIAIVEFNEQYKRTVCK